jgi:hypothetical protein
MRVFAGTLPVLIGRARRREVVPSLSTLVAFALGERFERPPTSRSTPKHWISPDLRLTDYVSGAKLGNRDLIGVGRARLKLKRKILGKFSPWRILPFL